MKNKLYKILQPDQEQYNNIIETISSLKEIRNLVELNHDDNKWWPNYITDYRIRMLVAGLSTRVNYNMIQTFQEVVKNVSNYSYEELDKMKDKIFKILIGKIGLQESRLKFKLSLFKFLNQLELKSIDIKTMQVDESINLIKDKVYGAGYKVAQCCIAYAIGFDKGIMPVDSGMKDVLGKCLGFKYSNSPKGHEEFRKILEHKNSSLDTESIIKNNDYNINTNKNNNWWAHLLLIYYKRSYCNKRKWASCPIRENLKSVGCSCKKVNPKDGFPKLIIVEGIDKSGKTTLIEDLIDIGYKRLHFPKGNYKIGFIEFYKKTIERHLLNKDIIVLDRSFISEFVYGSVLRNQTRISTSEILDLISWLKLRFGPIRLIYLEETKEVVLKRSKSDLNDYSMISDNYEALIGKYTFILKQIHKIQKIYKHVNGDWEHI